MTGDLRVRNLSGPIPHFDYLAYIAFGLLTLFLNNVERAFIFLLFSFFSFLFQLIVLLGPLTPDIQRFFHFSQLRFDLFLYLALSTLKDDLSDRNND